MPIFEYVCSTCRHEFESLVRGDEQPVCPECGAERLDKKFSVPAAHAASSSRELPLAGPPAGGCGRPQCGMGGCQGLG